MSVELPNSGTPLSVMPVWPSNAVSEVVVMLNGLPVSILSLPPHAASMMVSTARVASTPGLAPALASAFLAMATASGE